jgi:hypothetical protein
MRHELRRHARRAATALCGVAVVAVAGCDDDDEDGLITPSAAARVQLANHSATPAFVKGLPAGAQAYSLIGSDDRLAASPNFVFGGSADGAGLLRNADGTYTILLNHEDNFAVSRITLDSTFRPVGGQYVVSSEHGRWRLCSATLATQEHGFAQPVYFTVGESGIESMIHAVSPTGAPNSSRLVTAFGRWNSENALPLPALAYPNRTVVIIGDDDSGVNGGQVAMYLADRAGDIESGRLYVMARTDNVTRERDMVVGRTYPVEFRQVPNAEGTTGAAIETAGLAARMIQFGRTEDLDYRKGSAAAGREVYFNVTGQNNTGTNADFSRTKYGRVYKLTLDASNPLRGTLEVILDGDDRAGPARQFQNPDNIFVGENYAYIKEDPNGYGDETHDAYVYQYNLATKQLQVVMELDHRRTAADAAKYNRNTSTGEPQTSRFGSWEYGAMLDMRPTTGVDAFLIAVQPHTWVDARFRNVAGPHTALPNEWQGSQLIVVTGLPR